MKIFSINSLINFIAMRKIFTLITLCLLATAAWGQTTIEFVAGNPSVPAGSNTSVTGPDEMTMGGITVKTTSGAFNAPQYRFGKNATTTITSTVGNITKIVFECTKDNPASGFDEGQGIVVDGNNGTWNGNANEITLTSNVKQVRATKITFTVGGDGLADPSIKPAGGTYYSPIEVTITCGTSGADIYYTTNGNEPSTSSTKYTAPFTLSANATVKAISAKDGKTSNVVTAEYVFETATPVPNIAAFQNTADETMVTFTNPVNVLAQSGQRMFVKDNTGYALFYGTAGQTYKNGDVIPAGFAGLKTTWDGEPELKNLAGFQPASGNSPIAAEYPFSAANVNHDHFGHFVAFKNATITKVENNYTLTDENGDQCAIYFGSMGVSAPTDLDAKYDIEAIVGSYGKNTVWQLLPTKLEPVGGVTPPPPGDAVGLDELYDIATNAPGTNVTIKNDAIVLGQVGKYLYLKDVDKGYVLVYGTIGKTYQLGDVIPAGYGGLVKIYDMEPEIYDSFKGFEDAKGNIGGRDALEAAADKITISQVGHETWGHYVVIDNVTINTTDKTFSDATGTIGYYDRFSIQWPDDLTKTYRVYAIVGSYKTNYQLLPTRIVFEEIIPDVANLEELYALPKGKQAHFTEPLTAIFQSKEKRDLYIIDATGKHGLVYGDVDGNFVNGDYINDAIASWTTYNDNYQLTPKADTFVPAGHGDAVEPEEMPIEEISQDMVHCYFAFENVTIEVREEDGKTNYYMKDETGEMMLFDRYSVGLSELDLTKTYDVKAFLTVFRGIMELYPIEVKVHGGSPSPVELYDVNHDGEINVADINVLIDYILTGSGVHDCNQDGEMTVADINVLIDYVLNN